jgi:hypothetical protein
VEHVIQRALGPDAPVLGGRLTPSDESEAAADAP